MQNPNLKALNRRALLLMLVGLLLAAILFSLPLYSFQARIFTKKSANTFVGDEKYQSVRAEMEEIAESYRADGFDVDISEDVTLRTNSKGEQTSLIAFSVTQDIHRNLWSFLPSSLPSAHVLRAIALCMLLSAACALLGLRGEEETVHRYLPARSRRLRTAAGVLLLIAVLLVPVFLLMNNYFFSRRLALIGKGLISEGVEQSFRQADSFLFGGRMGEKIGDALSGLQYDPSGMLWLLIPCLLLSIVFAIQLRNGEIKSALLRGLLYFFVVVMCLAILYPYYVMLVTGFRSNAETLDINFLHMFPTEWKFENLAYIVQRGVPRYLLNSLIIAGGATLLAMLCGIPAAYAMARMSFRGKKAFLGFVIMSQMFSPVVLLIGISQLMSTLHLNDSVLGLMLINAAFNQAFAIWLLRGTFVSISPEMEQAALIDGCSTMGSLTAGPAPHGGPRDRDGADLRVHQRLERVHHLHRAHPAADPAPHHRGYHAVQLLQHDRVAVPVRLLAARHDPGRDPLHDHREAPHLRSHRRRRQGLSAADNRIPQRKTTGKAGGFSSCRQSVDSLKGKNENFRKSFHFCIY